MYIYLTTFPTTYNIPIDEVVHGNEIPRRRENVRDHAILQRRSNGLKAISVIPFSKPTIWK